MDNLDYGDVDWFFVFCDTDQRHWYNLWLKPGFQHVWALRYQGDQWIAISPQQGFTDVDVISDGRLINTNPTILHVKASRVTQRVRVPWLLMPFTCVEQVKSLIGLRHWSMTPWQLYKALTMDGLKGIIADGVAEGMQTAHMNKTPSEVEQEHPDMGPGLPLKSLLHNMEKDHE